VQERWREIKCLDLSRYDEGFLVGTDLVMSPEGFLYMAQSALSRIVKVTLDGELIPFVGGKEPRSQGHIDDKGDKARLNRPVAIDISPEGNLYVADMCNDVIRMVTPEGEVSTLAGSGEDGMADGPVEEARFMWPCDVAVDSRGHVYVADGNNHRLCKIIVGEGVTTVAGNGERGFKDGVGGGVRFSGIMNLAIDPSDNIYAADMWNHRIRKVTPMGAVCSIAGNGVQASKDGVGEAACLSMPNCLTIDSAGTLYLRYSNYAVRRITPKGEVSTIGWDEGFPYVNELVNVYIDSSDDRMYALTDEPPKIYILERVAA